MHKRELRNGIHPNGILQSMYRQYGDVFTYEVVEECSRDVLREREQHYIDNETGTLMNLAKEVCELAPSEVHSERMKAAWAKRTPEKKAQMSRKISETLKKTYRENPETLKTARDALAKGRSSEALKRNKHTPEANEKRRQAALRQWANRDAKERKAVSALISRGVMDNTTPEQRTEQARKAAKARKYT